ncbi:MAG TPA: ParM/StbA family protein [Ktedonobacteraceae bacterium]|nr:ParM/StbA family protein [Ktedonobacteraceae bacterium]
MRTTYAAGYDYGNSDACLVAHANGERKSLTLPSATALGTLRELTDLGIRLGLRDIVYKDEATEMYVGDLALRQADQAFTGRGDIRRYWSRKSGQVLVALAACLLDEERFDLHLVTGLPIATYLADAEARERVKAALEGEWCFSLNGVQRRVGVAVERVMMEGAGAGISYGFREGLTAIIDIGGRTTDLYVADGQVPLRHKCAGKPLGVELAADLMNATFERRYRHSLSVTDQRAILRAFVSHGKSRYPRVFVGGEPVEALAVLAEEALDQVGSEIASWIATKLNSTEGGIVAGSYERGRVLVVGGGAHYFLPAIQRVIPIASTVEAPEEANARGYAAFALAHLPKVGYVTR